MTGRCTTAATMRSSRVTASECENPSCPVDEGAGAVDRVDDEAMRRIQSRGVVGAFLGQPAVIRARAQKRGAEVIVDRQIGLGHRAGALFLFPGRRLLPPEAAGDLSGFQRGIHNQVEVLVRRRQRSFL